MFIALIVVHVLVAVALVLVVLLQVGKGQSIGAAFGGASSSQTIFGSRGPATFLSRLTTVAAAHLHGDVPHAGLLLRPSRPDLHHYRSGADSH